MPRAIADVAPGRKYLILGVRRLDPFQVDHLRREELRERLLNLIVLVDCEQIEAARRIVAAVLHLQWQIMEEVQTLSAAIQERADIIREPYRRKDIQRRFAGPCSEIRFR